MENNNSFKTIMWIIVGLVVAGIIVFLVTKDKKPGDENMMIGEATVDEIDVMKLESFPIQVNVLAKGHLPDGCTTLGAAKQTYANNKFTIVLETKKPLSAEQCIQTSETFQKTISLSGVVGLPKGTYSVSVNGKMGTFSLDMDNFISTTDPLK